MMTGSFVTGIAWIGLVVLSFFREDLILSGRGKQRIRQGMHKIYVLVIRIIWACLGAFLIGMSFLPERYIWWVGTLAIVLLVATVIVVRKVFWKKNGDTDFVA